MERITRVRWQSWEGDATEELALRETEEGFVAQSVIKSSGKERFAVAYTIVGDGSWRVRNVKIDLAERGQKLELASDGLGRWSNESGAVAQLDGAIDIDISATPFTNTLPIRRLGLAAGQSTEISVVYISMPDLDVYLEGQRYTCLVLHKLYRFESLDSDFVREIEVDQQGLLVRYPGLYRRT